MESLYDTPAVRWRNDTGNGSGNRLLSATRALQPDAFGALQARTVTIRRGTVLAAADEPPTRLYFIDRGIASAIGETASGQSLEVGFVGAEGVSHVGWLLGGTPPAYAFVAQFALTAHEVDARHLQRVLAADARHPLHCLIQMYGQFVIGQLAQSTLCARFHTSAQRLARWLLLTAVSVDADALPLTHEAVAHMVGAPRSQVTDAIGTLRDAGCIKSTRGMISIVDARKLRKHACECFAIERDRLASFERRLQFKTHGPRAHA